MESSSQGYAILKSGSCPGNPENPFRSTDPTNPSLKDVVCRCTSDALVLINFSIKTGPQIHNPLLPTTSQIIGLSFPLNPHIVCPGVAVTTAKRKKMRAREGLRLTRDRADGMLQRSNHTPHSMVGTGANSCAD